MKKHMWTEKKRQAGKCGLIWGLAVLAAAAGISGCQSRQYEKVVLEAETAEGTGSSETAQSGQAEADVSPAEVAGNMVEMVAASGVITQGQQAAASSENAQGQQAAASPEDAQVQQALALEERDETVYVCAENLNVRQAPRPDAPVVTRVNTGTEMKRTGYSGEWSRVVLDGQECYAASRYLSVTKPETSGTNGASSGASGGSGSSVQAGEVGLNPDWKYAGFAKITSGKAVLYRSEVADRKGKVVCVNAGHGTKGGSSVKTQCHPDGTPKVTGGTTGAGATSAVAVSGGMQFSDGTAEAKVTLAMAKVLKNKLLARGYDVLMIRESDDVQLDNIARTVIANNKADCHIALHWDSTESNKGAFYMSVPNVASYRSMEPVASHWQQHHALGDSLIAGLKNAGVKIFSGGKMDMDLTQTSYSTVPSVDIELGDKASDHSAAALEQLGNGLADGVDLFFAP